MEEKRIPNSKKFKTMQEMAEAGGGYITAGCPEISELARALLQNIVGKTKINGEEIVCLPYGTLGRAAITSVLGTLGAGGHIVATNDIFGGTWAFLSFVFPTVHRGQVTFVENTDQGSIREALRNDTRVFFAETFSNPMLKVTDIPACIQTIKEFNPEILVIIDDTVTAGLHCEDDSLFTPLNFGVDLTVQSLTKYVCGYNDERGGSVIGANKRAPKWLQLPGLPFDRLMSMMDILGFVQRVEGSMMHPETAKFLLPRVEGLHKRMRKHSENALAFAQALDGSIVNYPGLDSHLDHVTAKQMGLAEFGGLVSFRTGGDYNHAAEIVDKMAQKGIGVIANSFGDKETFIEAVFKGMEKLKHILEKMGLPEDIIRIAIGHGPSPEEMSARGALADLILEEV